MLGKRAFVTVVLEVVNATLSKDHINDQQVGPITIPSLGAEGEL